MHRFGGINFDARTTGPLPIEVETTKGHDVGRGCIDDDGGDAGSRLQNAGRPGRAGDGDRKGDGDGAELAGIEAVDLAARARLRERSPEGRAWRDAAAGV